MAQTTVQHVETIRFGSAKFEMGATVGTLVNVGAIRNGVFDYTFDKVSVKSDNAGTIKEAVANEKASLGGDLMEINLTNLGSFYTGVLSYATIAAAPVAITDEIHVLTGTTESELDHANGAGTEVASIVVTNAAGTVTLVRDCDYTVNVNADGSTSIARSFPAVVVTAHADITPNVAGTYTDGGAAFPLILAPGDHIIIVGCGIAANNGVKTIVTATNAVLTVAEAVQTEVASGSTTITRGGIASGDTTLTDYSYTPAASRSLKGGGLTTFTARVARFTNTDSAGKTLVITVFSTTPDAGLTINFQPDDGEDPAVCPIKMVGTPDTTLTAGEQLFEVIDSQHV